MVTNNPFYRLPMFYGLDNLRSKSRGNISWNDNREHY